MKIHIKNILLILACVLLTPVFASAVDRRVPAPAVVEPGAAPGNMQVSPPGLPANVPSSVTPDKIKEFLSRPKEENYIILNFDNADIKDVINTVSTITNENFILSPGLDARITIHSAKKIPVSEVLTIFESVLEVNGMALVRSGRFYKIVSASAAKQKPLDVMKSRDADSVNDIDRPITQIVQVNYVPVTEISTVLTPMLSPTGSIIPNPRNNLLIINDLSSSIVRLLKILKEIDVDAFKNTRMSFFKPRYSDVVTLSNELTEVLGALNLSKEGIALVPIERINSLVIFSASPTLLKTMEGWIRKLDEEVMTGQNIFVYPVQNVKADTIATILNSLYNSDSGTQVKSTKNNNTQKRGTARTISSRSNAVKQQAGRVEIMTFEPTNSLVILSPPGIYREMVSMIKKIDIYPREVLIEAVIAEVDVSESAKFGIQWANLNKINIGGNEYKTLLRGKFGDTAALPVTPPSFDSVTDGGLSFVMFRADDLVAMVNALASESKMNILSSPRLLVRDQEEASIEVGSEIPTASSTTSTTTADTLTQNIEYRTVGIKLKIKPTISEEKTVVLDIEQEVSALGGDQQVGQKGNTFPSFTTTKTKTSIVVPDQQGIIIGGIMEETEQETQQGIPFLSKIPVLGYLFRYTEMATVKKELIIIVTPRVVADRTEADMLTRDYMDQLKNVKAFLQDKSDQVDLNGILEPAPSK